MSVCLTDEQWEDMYLSYPDPEDRREAYNHLVESMCEHFEARDFPTTDGRFYCPDCRVVVAERQIKEPMDPIQAAEMRFGA